MPAMPTPLPPTDKDGWRACLSGELVQCGLARRRAMQRRTILRQMGAAIIASAVAGSVAAILLWSLRVKSSPPWGVVCNEVARLLPEYLAQRLSRDKADQVAKHLESCPHCAALRDRLERRV